MVRNKRGNKEKWIPGTVVKITGPSTYIVRMAGNVRRFVHADHITCNDSLEKPVSEKIIVSLGNQYGPINDSSKLQTPIDITSDEESTQNPVQSPAFKSCPQESSSSSPTKVASVKHPETVPNRLSSPLKASRAGRLIKPPQRLDL